MNLWPYAMQTAAYLYNKRVPKKGGVTPMEALTVVRPDLSHLHVWGCKVFCKINASVRINKKTSVTRTGIFVQYCDTATTFTVLINNIPERCTDIVFDETSFPVDPTPDRHPDGFSILNPGSQPVPIHARDPVTTEPSKRQKTHHPIIQTAGGQRERRIPVHPDPLTFKSFTSQMEGTSPNPIYVRFRDPEMIL